MTSAAETTKDWAEQRQIDVQFEAQTGSTNDNAKTKASRESADFVLYLTEHQTAGRSRGANHWLDTGAGECLLSTWSFAVASPPQAITGPRIGLALFMAASRTWPSLSWGLKAPNDLYLDGNKTGGLLVESVSSGSSHRLIIGLGLNVVNHPRRFTTATHLSGALGRTPEEGEWFQFLDELRSQFEGALPDIMRPTLSNQVCQDLKQALNANSARPFVVNTVSPQGDLAHSQGTIRWTEL